MRKILEILVRLFESPALYAGDEIPDYVKICQSIAEDAKL